MKKSNELKSEVRRRHHMKRVYRITLELFLFLIFLYITYALFIKSISINKVYKLNYSEKSNVDYSVCLKKNDFYESECLEKGMKYVASLIDTVKLKIDYSFLADQLNVADYSSSLFAKLIISDPSDNNNIIFSKDYELEKEETKRVENEYGNKIEKEIEIDYDKYNILANQFKSTYGVSSNARLEVHFMVSDIGYSLLHKELAFNIDNDLVIKIPLSQDAINIELNYASIDGKNTIYYNIAREITNKNYLILSCISFVFALIVGIKLCIYLYKVYNKKTEYNKTVDKLLKDYDRLIVEGRTHLHTKDYDVIYVDKFEELVDVHDNLKTPIIYLEIVENKESWFYVKDENNLYLYTLKSKSSSDKNEKNKDN